MTGEMTGEDSDDGAVAPRVGGGWGGSCDPPAGSADGYACRLDGTRAQGGRGARVGLVRELPPQRGAGRPAALLCGGAGPCRGHTAAPVALRRRCARPRAAGCVDGQDGRQRRGRAGRELGAFRRRPRPALLSILSSLDSARCVARRRLSRPWPKIPARAARRLFRTSDLTGYTRCVRLPVRCTRTPVRRHAPSFVLLAIVRWQLSDRIFSCCAFNQPPGDDSIVFGTVKITPDTWQKRKLMAADCLVSLDALPSRLLSAPDPGQFVLA